MRDEVQTSGGSSHAAQGPVTARVPSRVLGRTPNGIIARLVRGKRAGDAAPPEVPHRPTQGALPPVTSDKPELQGLHRRRISPRPAGFEAPAKADRVQAATRTQAEKATSGAPRRKRGLGFALVVVLPFLAVALYMGVFARPQYTSTVAFTVRSVESGGVNDALSGIAQFAGAPRSTDALILAAFLQSQTLLERLNRRLDLVRHYAEPFDIDPLFALSPSARVEARLSHWRRVLTVQADPATGLIELQVNAFSPEMAQLVARELLVESRALLNDLNAEAQGGVTAHAEAEFDAAERRLADARAELTAFRTESRIFDPNSDFEGRVVVLRHLQGQLARALVEQDLQTPDGAEAPRVRMLRSRIDAELERLGVAPDGSRADYPELLAMHERLAADRDYAEAAFRAARTTLDLALAQAARRDLYLAVFVEPTLPERPDHARTLGAIGLAALFLCLTWTLGVLVRAAVLDRR